MEGKLVAIVFTILAIVSLVQVFHFYNTVNYQADKAGGYILGVKSTNNINDMKAYFQKALDQLNAYNYHGSPILWPTAYTSWDYLKADLQKNINALNEYQRTYNTTSDKSYAYQQVINNAKSNADTLNNRQSAISENVGFNPSQNPVGYTFVVLFLLAWPAIKITTAVWEDRLDRIREEKWQAKYGK